MTEEGYKHHVKARLAIPMPLRCLPFGLEQEFVEIAVRLFRTGLCEAHKLDGELCGYKARASSLPFCGVHWKEKAE